MEKKLVLATQTPNPLAMELLSEQVGVRVASNLDPRTIARQARDAHGIFLRLGEISAEVIETARHLEVIGRNGVGLDTIDMEAANSRAIAVVYTPDANSISVAEHVVGSVLALARRYPLMDRETRRGNWAVREQSTRELHGLTFGFVGLGRIGSLAARMCRGAFDAEILAYDPYIASPEAEQQGVRLVDSLDVLLARSDVVSLHVSLSAATRGLMGPREFALMKPTAYLVNASRGAVVDEAALVQALLEGAIAGAALDVFDEEPLLASHPLCQMSNVLLTPHNAAQTVEAKERMTRTLVADMLAVLSGQRPRYLANPRVWDARR